MMVSCCGCVNPTTLVSLCISRATTRPTLSAVDHPPRVWVRGVYGHGAVLCVCGGALCHTPRALANSATHAAPGAAEGADRALVLVAARSGGAVALLAQRCQWRVLSARCRTRRAAACCSPAKARCFALAALARARGLAGVASERVAGQVAGAASPLSVAAWLRRSPVGPADSEVRSRRLDARARRWRSGGPAS